MSGEHNIRHFLKPSCPKESMKRATPSYRSGIGEYGKRLGGSSNLLQIIFLDQPRQISRYGFELYPHSFIQIVCFCFVICTHYHHVHGNSDPYNWYQSKVVILRMDLPNFNPNIGMHICHG